MNVLEGSQRMQRAGRRITVIALALLILLIVIFESWVYFRDAIRVDLMAQFTVPLLINSIPLAAAAICVGVALWVAGWIMEGFAKNNPS